MLDKKLLVTGILISLALTVIITLIARKFGVSLFFVGIFLPFFFYRKKIAK